MVLHLILMAVVIGILMPVQAGLNAELTRHLKHPYMGAFLSLSIGSVMIFLMIFLNGSYADFKRVTQTPPHLFLGGILGAIFVSSSLYLIPKMGATALICAFMTGQLIGSVLLDHFGLLGLPSYPLSIQRILGIFLLFSGLLLVVRKST
jgi:transporter family-2 protein